MARNFAGYSTIVPLGTTWEEAWQLLQAKNGPPVDLTGYEARMQLRSAVTATAVALELTTENERLVITPAEGRIRLEVSAEDVSTLSPDNAARTFVYDVELFKPEVGAVPEYVLPLFSGKVKVKPRVTR